MKKKKYSYPEYNKEHNKKWNDEHPSYRKEYYQEHKDEIKAKQREYWKHHGKEIEARRITKLRTSIFELLGESCSRCGFDDKRALQIDHVNGGGSAERKHISIRKLYQNIIAVNGKGYQILCANCNWIKRHENDELHSGSRQRPNNN